MFEANLEYGIRVQQNGGLPQISTIIKEKFDCESIVRTTIELADGMVDEEFKISSAEQAGSKFLLITSSVYDDGSGDLKYRVGTSPVEIKLEHPHVIRGTAYLPSAVTHLTFTNNLGVDAVVDVIFLSDSAVGGGSPPISGGNPRYEKKIATALNTIPNLTYTPQDGTSVILFYQGMAQEYTDDYTISGKVVSWVSGDFDIPLGAVVWFFYLSSD